MKTRSVTRKNRENFKKRWPRLKYENLCSISAKSRQLSEASFRLILKSGEQSYSVAKMDLDDPFYQLVSESEGSIITVGPDVEKVPIYVSEFGMLKGFKPYAIGSEVEFICKK